MKLIELTNNSEDYLTWYRSALPSRTKSLQENLSRENIQRKALRHLNMLGIVISNTCFYNVIKIKLMKISEKRTI